MKLNKKFQNEVIEIKNSDKKGPVRLKSKT